MRRRYLTASLLASVAGGLILPAHADTTKVGVAAAINPAAEGQSPDTGPVRTLYVGSDVMYKERIVTSADGQAQLLFLDQSAMTVAPNSELVIDEFVYDPNKNTAKLAATMAKGLLRFVGGRASKDQDVTITTPTAVIGIRGGVALINVGRGGNTTATFLFGRHMSVTSGGQTQLVTRPGFSVQTTTANTAPSAPIKATANQISGAFASLEGKPGVTAGAQQTPTEQNIPHRSIATTGTPAAITPQSAGQKQNNQQAHSETTNSPTANIKQPAQEQAKPKVVTVTESFSGRYKATPSSGDSLGTTDFSTNRNRSYSGAKISNGKLTATLNGESFEAAANDTGKLKTFSSSGTASPFGPVRGNYFISNDKTFFYFEMTNVNFPDIESHLFGGIPSTKTALTSSGQGIDTFTIRRDAILDSNLPFTREAGGGSIPGAQVSNLYLARQSAATLGDYSNLGLERSTAMLGAVAIDGQGSKQRSAITVMTGFIADDGNFTSGDFSNGKPLFVGGAMTTARTSATEQFVITSTGVTGETDNSGNSFFGKNVVSNFVLDNAFVTSANHRLEQLIGSEFTQNRSSSVNPSFNQVVTATSTPAGVGTNRTEQTLNGYVGGLGQSVQVGGTPELPVILRNTGQSDPTQLTIKTFPTLNRLSAQFNIEVSDPATNSPKFGSAKFNFGGVGNASDITEFQGKSFFNSRSAFVDDNLFAAREQRIADGTDTGKDTTVLDGTVVSPGGVHTYLITSAAVDTTGLLPNGVQFCSCQYLKWGYWGADVTNPNNTNERDGGHLMTWVAGVLPSLAEIPRTGQASYSGHLVGNVFTSSAQYVAVGNFTNSWNFGTRSGTITINKFDGMNFSGSASATVANPRDYSGTFSGTLGHGANATTLNGNLNGSFFKGGGDPVAETGGHFSIANSGGTTYRAAGIFAAKK